MRTIPAGGMSFVAYELMLEYLEDEKEDIYTQTVNI